MSIDVVIPVYNEGAGIVEVLVGLEREFTTPHRILICYDHDDDDTLPALKSPQLDGMHIVPVKNSGVGPHGAVITGFNYSDARAVIMFPADDTFNPGILDAMVSKFEAGCDIVCAARFIPGGCMEGCPWLKSFLVRATAWSMYHFARLPARDPTSGFRLFSRRVLDTIAIESTAGFTYSLELLVKAHRLGWQIGEVPAKWYERTSGKSRFKVMKWAPAYLKWYFYAFATTWLRRKNV